MAQEKRRVAKSNPEMQAVLANIDSLVDELQSLSAADGGGDFGPDAGAVEQPPVRGMASAAKGEEPFRTPAAPQVATNTKAPANEAGMAHWDNGEEENEQIKKAMKIMKAAGYNFEKPEDKEEDEEVQKALKLMKSIQSSDTEGPDAREPGEDRLEDMNEPDEENVDEVKKALALYRAITGKQTARKSQATKSRLAQSVSALTSVAKSLADRVQYQEAILSEVMEGLGIASTVTKDDKPQSAVGSRSVQKAAGTGPVMSYGNELGEVIGQAVAKAMQPYAMQQQSSNRPNGWDKDNDVRKSLGEVTLGLGQMANGAWGNTLPAPKE